MSYHYDGQRHAVPSAGGTNERGRPEVCDDRGSADALDSWLRGDSARLGAAPVTAFPAYITPTSSARCWVYVHDRGQVQVTRPIARRRNHSSEGLLVHWRHDPHG